MRQRNNNAMSTLAAKMRAEEARFDALIAEVKALSYEPVRTSKQEKRPGMGWLLFCCCMLIAIIGAMGIG